MKSLTDLKNAIKQKEADLRELEKQKPRIAGVVSVTILQENFTKHHGYRDIGGVNKWKERSKATNDAYDRRAYGSESVKGSVYSSKNPLLLQSRTLYDSLTYDATGSRVTIGFNENICPYARDVDEKRKIVGYNYFIRQRILAEFKKREKKIMKEFSK